MARSVRWAAFGPYLLVTTFYLVLGLLVRVHRGGPDWAQLMVVLDHVLDGNPWRIYEVRFFGGQYPFAYPPLSLLPVLPLRALSRLAGLSETASGAFVILPWMAFDVLSAILLIRLIGLFRPLSRSDALLIFTL